MEKNVNPPNNKLKKCRKHSYNQQRIPAQMQQQINQIDCQIYHTYT